MDLGDKLSRFIAADSMRFEQVCVCYMCARILLQAAMYASAYSYKLSRFIAADSMRFEQVWDMHEEEVQSKVLRMLQADKLIHEQQVWGKGGGFTL